MPRAPAEANRKSRKPPVTISPYAFTIPQFCAAHGFGLTQYYRMKKESWGPAEMEVGRRRLISLEAATRWRAEREGATTAAVEPTA